METDFVEFSGRGFQVVIFALPASFSMEGQRVQMSLHQANGWESRVI